jgi:hypothetical protein
LPRNGRDEYVSEFSTASQDITQLLQAHSDGCAHPILAALLVISRIREECLAANSRNTAADPSLDPSSTVTTSLTSGDRKADITACLMYFA